MIELVEQPGAEPSRYYSQLSQVRDRFSGALVGHGVTAEWASRIADALNAQERQSDVVSKPIKPEGVELPNGNVADIECFVGKPMGAIGLEDVADVAAPPKPEITGAEPVMVKKRPSRRSS